MGTPLNQSNNSVHVRSDLSLTLRLEKNTNHLFHADYDWELVMMCGSHE